MSVYLEDMLYSEDARDYIDDSSVIITLTKEATQKYKAYSEYDFKEIGCANVESLTQSTDSHVNEINSGVSSSKDMLIETDSYKQILKLDLKNVGVKNVARAIEMLNKRKDIFAVGPNYIYNEAVEWTFVPSDPFYGNEMWGLSGDYGIDAEHAWAITTGSNTIRVGIIDSGIQADHPDLVDRISTAGLHRDFTVDPEIEVSNANLVDPNGHGTHVAGIIGAHGNNSIGISGVCWNVSLVSLRVFDENGFGDSANLARAISYAASQNIPIINYSGGTKLYDINVHSALANYSGLFVCSAGNDGKDNDSSANYPSDFSRDEYCNDRVISVGSSNKLGMRAIKSNYGAESVSLFAPGDKILSTYPQGFCTGIIRETRFGEYLDCECKWTNQNNDEGIYEWYPTSRQHYENGYHYNSGTSMAAPYVTGVAALLLSKYPYMSAEDIKTTIMQNVDETFRLKNLCVSGGRLNAYTALSNPQHRYGHDYTSRYVWQNNQYHKAYCVCDDYITSSHAVSATPPVSPNKPRYCLLCGGKVDFGIVIDPPLAKDISLVTANGSYVLPNGIVVLVDLDIESYINGTLKFYDKNLVTQ